ncbi:MAG: ParB/RepB/Spo0J family partition protein [candidate division Zixibacteria bacterium]|nr:ParB/RepB/Spo0J family partition protein [candidate division Zixibacteria bacterium]
MSRTVLGKGIEALIPGFSEDRFEEKGNLIQVDIKKVKPNPYQPRGTFDQTKLEELADSIRQKGLVQPIVIRQKEDGFELVVGERRLLAAQKAGLSSVPALLLDKLTKQEMMEMALVENIQREDLNPIDQAKGYSRLITECGVSQKELSKRIGKDRSSISNILRLLNLPEKIQQYLSEGKLSEGHARAILAIPDKKGQISLAERIVKQGLSVRRVEEIVYKRKETKKGTKKHRMSKYSDLENKLREYLKTAVKISQKQGRGRIEIEFYSEEDLGRILELFNLKI